VPLPLSALLAQVLLSYTLAFERDSPLSLPILENVVRALGDDAADRRELPAAAAVSPEAVSMALTFLTRQGYIEGTQVVRLKQSGRAARERAQACHPRVSQAMRDRDGQDSLDRLRAATRGILDQRDGERRLLARGLEPHTQGWRAGAPYRKRTDAMLADPLAGLPRHPIVLHRGGWPDGS
jgi:hypothetical protein